MPDDLEAPANCWSFENELVDVTFHASDLLQIHDLNKPYSYKIRPTALIIFDN